MAGAPFPPSVDTPLPPRSAPRRLTGTPGDFFYGPAAPAALGGSGAVHGSVAARSGRRALFVRLAALV